MHKFSTRACSAGLQQALVNLPKRPAITAAEANAWLATLPPMEMT
ncbi:MAG: hypothetical protein V4720_06335 [Pseudomonadota bacterium]